VKLDGAIIRIRPRSLDLCIDLAAAFYRVHFKQIATLVLGFALPCVGLAGLLAAATPAGAFLGFGIFFVVSPLLGAIVVSGVGPRVFGEPFTVGRTVAFLRGRARELTRYVFWPRVGLALVGLLCWAVDGFFFALFLFALPGLLGRSFMVAEVVLLERLSGARVRERLAGLRAGIVMDLVGRWIGVLVFYGVALSLVFTLVEAAAYVLFGIEIFLTRTVAAGDWIPRFINEPRAVMAIQALLWLGYPLARMALFFCYLDVRTRKECWDLELDFRIEARRLGGRG